MGTTAGGGSAAPPAQSSGRRDGARGWWTPAHGGVLRALRQERGWSQRVLAERAGHGVTQQDVSEWETGAAVPSGPKLRAVLAALGATPEALQRRAEGILAAEAAGEAALQAVPAPAAGGVTLLDLLSEALALARVQADATRSQAGAAAEAAEAMREAASAVRQAVDAFDRTVERLLGLVEHGRGTPAAS